MSRLPSRRLTIREGERLRRRELTSPGRSKRNSVWLATKSKRWCRWSSSRWNSLRSYRIHRPSRSKLIRILRLPSSSAARSAKTWWVARATAAKVPLSPVETVAEQATWTAPCVRARVATWMATRLPSKSEGTRNVLRGRSNDLSAINLNTTCVVTTEQVIRYMGMSLKTRGEHKRWTDGNVQTMLAL